VLASELYNILDIKINTVIRIFTWNSSFAQKTWFTISYYEPGFLSETDFWPTVSAIAGLLVKVIHCRSDYWYGHGRTGRTGDDGLGIGVTFSRCGGYARVLPTFWSRGTVPPTFQAYGRKNSDFHSTYLHTVAVVVTEAAISCGGKHRGCLTNVPWGERLVPPLFGQKLRPWTTVSYYS